MEPIQRLGSGSATLLKKVRLSLAKLQVYFYVAGVLYKLPVGEASSLDGKDPRISALFYDL